MSACISYFTFTICLLLFHGISYALPLVLFYFCLFMIPQVVYSYGTYYILSVLYILTRLYFFHNKKSAPSPLHLPAEELRLGLSASEASHSLGCSMINRAVYIYGGIRTYVRF